jgi:hypothetical protein
MVTCPHSFKTISIKANQKVTNMTGWGKRADPLVLDCLDEMTRKSNGNYGVLCGPRSGVLVLDYDLDKVPEITHIHLESLKGVHGNTMIVQTPKGGFHVYHSYDERFDSWIGRCGLNNWEGFKAGETGFIDVRTHGNYVVGPGSVVNGKVYTVVNDVEPARMPDDMFEALDEFAHGAKYSFGKSLDVSKYDDLLESRGFTNISWVNEYDFDCDQRGKGSTCPLCSMTHENNHFFLWSIDGTVYVKNHSNRCKRVCIEKSEKKADEEPLNDKTAFEKVISKFGSIVKRYQSSTMIFNETNGIWLSKHEDVLGLWYKLCQEVLSGTNYGTQVKKQQTIFNLCSTLPDSEDFFEKGRQNRLGKLLYKDCVWNIETNSRESFNPEYFFKFMIPRTRGVYNKKAYDEVFKLLFNDTQSDVKERNELWKYLSVAATGKQNKRCLVNNIGLSGTGKTTLINAFLAAFPGYANDIKMSAFIVTNFTKANDHNDELLKFENSRWLFTSEQVGTADCELVKNYTGGDSLNARGCGSKTGKSFYSESLLFTMSNGPLKFNKMDDALLKRIKPFFWKNQFENPCEDVVKILNTAEGYEALDCIIQDGYNLWKKEGFLCVESLETLKNDIKGDQESFDDIFERVFKVEEDKKNKEFWIKSTEVYNFFADLKESDFNIKYKMTEKGIECKQDRGLQGRLHYFKGLSYR